MEMAEGSFREEPQAAHGGGGGGGTQAEKPTLKENPAMCKMFALSGDSCEFSAVLVGWSYITGSKQFDLEVPLL